MSLQNVYGLSYGTLKVKRNDLLKRKDYEELMRLVNPADFISYLSNHGYDADISANSSQYSGYNLIEAATNTHLAKLNKLALSLTPKEGRDLVASYLTKWDIMNIKTIMVAKNLNYKVEDTEMHLVSENMTTLGIFAGLLSHSDYKNLLSMGSIEDMISYLLKFGYGKALLSYLDDYRKSNSLSSLLLSLDLYYYSMLREKFRFYTGTEGPVYRFIKGIIDIKNIITIMKFKEFGGGDNVSNYLLQGGNLSDQILDDLIKSSSVEEVALKVKPFFDLTKSLEFYKTRGSLTGFEGELYRNLYWNFIEIFEMSPLSVNNILAYLLRAEGEWKDVRNIFLSRYYKIDEETVRMMSVNIG
ncbi:MAG: V-type ATPase subunit [Thermoplasmatales archaeon]